LLVLVTSSSFSQEEDFHHPELHWRTIETPHFLVHYHDGSERTARVVAKVAEEVFDPVTSLYNHIPSQKVSFIIKDYDDISNGAAYFFDNRIEIYGSSMDYELRGTHNWLRNVVTHEFTHIVQIQTSMKFGRTVPSVYLQWLNYESERRPDVLYGYPNVIASYPVSGFVVPAWFAEGVAQYNRTELRYDFWDAHRDMILRSYALDGNMLTWEQMGVFGKTGLGNESSYNSGFAFVSYLAHRYGEEKLAEISRNLATLTETTIDGAIGRAVGKSGRDVYEDWRSEIKTEYASRIAPVKAALRVGTPLAWDSKFSVIDPNQIESDGAMYRPTLRGGLTGPQADACCGFNAALGFANLYPTYSPDGKKLAYTSAKNGDYFSLSALYVYDFVTKNEKLVQPAVRTPVAWSPDGNRLYYGKNSRDNAHWSLQFDLYEYDLTKEKETRITFGKRALSPTVSPDGKRIAFVVNADGTSNLAVANIDGSDQRVVTPYVSGEQVYTPRWNPAGDRIVFDFSIRDGRDIAVVRPDGSDLQFVLQGPEDTRSAEFTRDGSRLLFSSDRTGIFNLYLYELKSGNIEQVTNVVGGAFLPTISPDGSVVYAGYTSGGYKLFRLDSLVALSEGKHDYIHEPLPVPPATGTLTASTSAGGNGQQFDWSALRTYDDTKLSDLSSRAYKSTFTSLTVVPFVRVDNYNQKSRGIDLIKPGVYLFSSDVLDKTGFFAGASLNLNMERDLFLQFSYRGKIPLFYQLGLEPVATAELFNLTRKTDNVISLPGPVIIPVDVTYDLLEFDFALRQKALSQFSDVEFRYAHSRYASVIGNFINPETDPPSLVTGTRELYLIANTFTLSFALDNILPSRTSDINPVGRKILLRLSRELNKFNGDGEYEVTSIGLQPRYKSINFTRAELKWREHVALPFGSNTVTATVHGGTVVGPEVDDFFDFYAGGLVGMRGYPFYALGGNRMAVLGLEYRFPLIHNIDLRLFQIYFDKLYASVFADIGDTWSGPVTPSLSTFKKDIGAELRLESFSFYSYPTRIFASAAYGLDRFDRLIRRLDTQVTYGKEWRFYFGVLFGFDLE
jgi:Tol biopolymer transport system component